MLPRDQPMRYKPALSAWVALIILATAQHGYGKGPVNGQKEIKTCPNSSCASTDLSLRSRQGEKYLCKTCGKTFNMPANFPPGISVEKRQEILTQRYEANAREDAALKKTLPLRYVTSSQKPPSLEKDVNKFLRKYSNGGTPRTVLDMILSLLPPADNPADNNVIPIQKVFDAFSEHPRVTKAALRRGIPILEKAGLIKISPQKHSKEPLTTRTITVPAELPSILRKGPTQRDFTNRLNCRRNKAW